MVELRWTFEANKWLKEIHDYIVKDNPSAAKSVVNGIYDKAQILKSFPEIGYAFDHESNRNIRIILYGHYRIAYEIIDSETIAILGIFHGKTVIENHLK